MILDSQFRDIVQELPAFKFPALCLDPQALLRMKTLITEPGLPPEHYKM